MSKKRRQGNEAALRDHGITIPDDIALVSFSNNPNTTLVKSILTTVSHPAFEIGKTAASLLLKKLASKKDTAAETCVFNDRACYSGISLTSGP